MPGAPFGGRRCLRSTPGTLKLKREEPFVDQFLDADAPGLLAKQAGQRFVEHEADRLQFDRVTRSTKALGMMTSQCMCTPSINVFFVIQSSVSAVVDTRFMANPSGALPRGFHEETRAAKNRPGETGPVEAPLEARCQSLLFQPDRPADNIQAGNRVAVRHRSRLRLGQLHLQLVVEDMQVRERPAVQV